MSLTAPLGLTADLFWDDYGRRTTGIPVDLSSDTPVTIRLFTVPVLAGDILVIDGEVNVTNDVGRDPAKGLTRYTCGIGCHLWIYDANEPAITRPATWVKIGSQGENVTVDGHHLVMNIRRPYVVPAGWQAGHQIGVVLQADAHSTAWNANGGGEKITVENNGVLMCTRNRLTLDTLSTAVGDLAEDLATLAARVAALEALNV